MPATAVIAALLAIGALARLSPLFDIDGRLFWQYMTEDGYLMQTIARNMAIGLGMSTAEGTIATNGVQPLATFLFAALFKLAGGDKTIGIALVTVFSMLVSVAAVYYFDRFAAHLLAPLPNGRKLARFAAASWFAAPLIIRHSMNGLETGLYYLAILFTLDHYLSRPARDTGALSMKERLSFGALLGVTFLARNDAVFFIGGILAAHAFLGPRPALVTRLVDAVVAGCVSLVVASPWLIYNYTQFGSIIPISGTAQSHSSLLGQNLPWLPANLFESAYVVAPIPSSVEQLVPVVLLTLAFVAVSLVGMWRIVGQSSLAGRRIFVGYVLYGSGVCFYYGLFFGAPWFIPRYLSPQAILLWTGTVVTAYTLARAAARRNPALHVGVPALAAVVVLACGAFAGQQFKDGTHHMHSQVARWVNANVSPDIWVGGIQTGTLGFFHDRTINLDGKVNPEALKIIRHDGHVLDYVMDSKIDYVADWVGVAQWVERGDQSLRFHEGFEVVVSDRDQNLGVLHRIRPARTEK